MAFQSVANTAEIVITYSGHGKTFKNVMHAERVAGYLLADLVNLAGNVDAIITSDWLPIQSVDYLYVNTLVRGLELENDQETTDDTGSAQGALSASALPDNVTLAVKKASAFTGRSARGRLYWIGSPLSKIATNENQYTVAGSDEIKDAVDAMRVGIIADAWKPVIVSRFNAGVKREFGETFDWISTVLVDINVDSQRRRLL